MRNSSLVLVVALVTASACARVQVAPGLKNSKKAAIVAFVAGGAIPRLGGGNPVLGKVDPAEGAALTQVMSGATEEFRADWEKTFGSQVVVATRAKGFARPKAGAEAGLAKEFKKLKVDTLIWVELDLAYLAETELMGTGSARASVAGGVWALDRSLKWVLTSPEVRPGAGPRVESKGAFLVSPVQGFLGDGVAEVFRAGIRSWSAAFLRDARKQID